MELNADQGDQPHPYPSADADKPGNIIKGTGCHLCILSASSVCC